MYLLHYNHCRLAPAVTTYAKRNSSRKTTFRRGRSVDDVDMMSPTPHEMYKYNDISVSHFTVNISTPSTTTTLDPNSTVLETKNVTVTGTDPPTTPPTEPERKENIHYLVDVYNKREFIITGLGHFQDYNIKVRTVLFEKY